MLFLKIKSELFIIRLFFPTVVGGWFVLREKYCWLVSDKPNEQCVNCGCPAVHPKISGSQYCPPWPHQQVPYEL
jgi:hypothetical protein